MISGASAQAVANPTDVLKVRCQSQQGIAKNGVFKLIGDIYRNEGFTGLYRVFIYLYLFIKELNKLNI